MRVRHVLQVRWDGSEPEQRIELLSDATFAERMRELKKLATGEVYTGILTVVCDGCGRREDVDWDDPQLPTGWIDGEFCPFCR